MENPTTILEAVKEIIIGRGERYDFVEGNKVEHSFPLAAEIASLRLSRQFHAYEIAVIMACVKQARCRATPGHTDSHYDMIAYDAFAASFADDYALWFRQHNKKVDL